jgi:glycosyltransferase involved in cell wall biosynthesis
MGVRSARRKPSGTAGATERYDLALSVLVLTYNHERFLAAALQSALAQKATFLYEIVVGDDCSTDGTLEIASTFQAAHPHRIRVLRTAANRGPSNNFLETRKACKGKYIAILEGDDYWTDRNKLQRQVDLLESNAALSCCFHNVQLLQNEQLTPFDNAPFPKPAFQLPEIIRSNFICNCSTLVLRNSHVDRLPGWLAESRYYDWPLHVYNARQGAIGYIPDVMSVYRIHGAGAWHGANEVERIQAVLWLLARMQADFAGACEREFQLALGQWRAELARAAAAASSPPSPAAGASDGASPRILSLARSVLTKVRRRLARRAA